MATMFRSNEDTTGVVMRGENSKRVHRAARDDRQIDGYIPPGHQRHDWKMVVRPFTDKGDVVGAWKALISRYDNASSQLR